MNIINSQYDELIQSHPQEMRDAILFLESEMERRECKFGDKIIPIFLRPIFLPENHAAQIKDILEHIMNILEKVTHLYSSHPPLRDYFYLNEKEADLMRMDHGYQRNIIISRPDSFFVNETWRFVEFNCDSPAGPAFSDVEEDIFKESFPLLRLSDKYRFQDHHRMEYLLSALLSAYEEFAGKNKRPNIAILDWQEVRTVNEFRIIQSYFKKKGYDTIIADPRDLKFVGGRLECQGFPIDLVYRRVIFRELMERFDEVQDFIQAYRKGRVCVVNPLRSRLASNKAILSIMTNQRDYKEFFTQEENRVIHKHIPWTRRVRDIQTYFEDNQIFLRKHIINHKDSLVLKPGDSYGGRNVVIGCECQQPAWEVLVNNIIENNEDWVVQRYVEITKTTVPVIQDGEIELHQKKFNINPFVFGGRYAGSMARYSEQSVINVSAGGGLVPVIQYSPNLPDPEPQGF